MIEDSTDDDHETKGTTIVVREQLYRRVAEGRVPCRELLPSDGKGDAPQPPQQREQSTPGWASGASGCSPLIPTRNFYTK